MKIPSIEMRYLTKGREFSRRCVTKITLEPRKSDDPFPIPREARNLLICRDLMTHFDVPMSSAFVEADAQWRVDGEKWEPIITGGQLDHNYFLKADKLFDQIKKYMVDRGLESIDVPLSPQSRQAQQAADEKAEMLISLHRPIIVEIPDNFNMVTLQIDENKNEMMIDCSIDMGPTTIIESINALMKCIKDEGVWYAVVIINSSKTKMGCAITGKTKPHLIGMQAIEIQQHAKVDGKDWHAST